MDNIDSELLKIISDHFIFNPETKQYSSIYSNFPISWENEFGKFRFFENGKLEFLPKQAAEYLELNFTLSPKKKDDE